MTTTGRKKLDELYHPAAERSEFYYMADLHKPPVLFTPSEEVSECLVTLLRLALLIEIIWWCS